MRYIHELGELFEQVQLQAIFEDSKTFPDCIPLQPLSVINELYFKSKQEEGFNLTQFVNTYFLLPNDVEEDYSTELNTSPIHHICKLWEVLTRQPHKENSSLIPLKYPYIVPGGRFREVYYWDSYFTMLGLELSERYDLIESMIRNFAYLLSTLGHIPNANRWYYVGRSQPPFFALMLDLLSKKKGDQVYEEFLPELLIEYKFWMDNPNRLVQLDEDYCLNHYWDENNTPRPEAYKEDVELANHSNQLTGQLFRNLRAAAESGWDFSSRWFDDTNDFSNISTTQILPVDLNCLLYNLEDTIAKTYGLMGDMVNCKRYNQLSGNRKKAILKYFWSDKEKFFFDYNWTNKSLSKAYHLGGVFPLFFNLVTKDQASHVAKRLAQNFLKDGGLLTTLNETGQQWECPNGWAPLQWVTYKGLMNYNEVTLAKQIAYRWSTLNERVYFATGKFTEKYNVVTEDTFASGGEYPNQDGFGWTNGVYLKMKSELLSHRQT